MSYTYNSAIAKQCNVPDEILNEFCDYYEYDNLDIFNNCIIATVDEVTEEYYGHLLIQPVIKQQWPIDNFYHVVSNWYNQAMCEEANDMTSSEVHHYDDNIEELPF
jgi:hypothetical protein